MPKFLAIDWDETECRFAVAAIQKNKIDVRQIGIVPLEIDDETKPPLLTLAGTLRSFFKEEKIGSCPLLITLGRNKVEWLHQTLPPCKESEIPTLLKNQVLRELPGCNDFDPLDFLLLESSESGHRVLALIISLASRQSFAKVFRSLGHPPQQIGFRAVNTARIISCHPAFSNGNPLLLVNTAGNDADLILTDKNRITSIRSFRLATENQKQNLADEIERTLTIGLDGTAPPSIEQIVLFGSETENELTERLSKIGLSVRFLNPFDHPNVSVGTMPDEPEKFAPLIGSFLVQSQQIKADIDFLHPKEAPHPPNYVRPVLLACVLLGIVCAGLYQWNRSVIRGLEDKLAKTKAEHQQVAGELMQIQPSWNVLRQTQLWESQNVLWLDVLKELSVVLPNNTDLVVTQMSLTTGSPNNDPRFTGMISMTGMVRDPSVLLKLRQDLQSSGRYVMQYPAPSPNSAGGGYPWLFRTSIYRLR